MAIVIEVRWTPDAWRKLTEWVGAFARDADNIRAARDTYVEMIEEVILQTGGHPTGSHVWGPEDARIVEWEFVSGELWICHLIHELPVKLLPRLLGRRRTRTLVISALRRPRTLPEREAPQP